MSYKSFSKQQDSLGKINNKKDGEGGPTKTGMRPQSNKSDSPAEICETKPAPETPAQDT